VADHLRWEAKAFLVGSRGVSFHAISMPDLSLFSKLTIPLFPLDIHVSELPAPYPDIWFPCSLLLNCIAYQNRRYLRISRLVYCLFTEEPGLIVMSSRFHWPLMRKDGKRFIISITKRRSSFHARGVRIRHLDTSRHRQAGRSVVTSRQRQIYINVVYRAQFPDELQIKSQQSQPSARAELANRVTATII
jgi:hypothetical protein